MPDFKGYYSITRQSNRRFPCLTWLTKLLYLKRFSLN